MTSNTISAASACVRLPVQCKESIASFTIQAGCDQVVLEDVPLRSSLHPKHQPMCFISLQSSLKWIDPVNPFVA